MWVSILKFFKKPNNLTARLVNSKAHSEITNFETTNFEMTNSEMTNFEMTNFETTNFAITILTIYNGY